MLSICMRIILCIYQQSIIPTTLGKLHDHPNLFFFLTLCRGLRPRGQVAQRRRNHLER